MTDSISFYLLSSAFQAMRAIRPTKINRVAVGICSSDTFNWDRPGMFLIKGGGVIAR